jgi:DNA invertase Pin-like site-specific DNA recombinase
MSQPDSSQRASEQRPPGRPGPVASGKISSRHLLLLAIVYIRQSSLQQVFNHTESTARQYELADRAVSLGWPAERVLTIDDDQGLSGQTASGRGGFQRLLAEVGMGHVGLVLGLEMSRLARCNADFQRLLELCAISGTLIADQDGVYDPRDPNDRLLLGLKGTMSEFELITMRQRLQDGRMHKAGRAALFHTVPIGYVKVGKDQVELDPDEQVRRVVELVFAKFEELGSLGALWRYLREAGICIGVRLHKGPRRGQLQWHRPSRSTLRQILHNPIYAGAYAYGRSTEAGAAAERKRKQVGMPDWKVLKQGCLPAYISWEQYLANRTRLRSNRAVAGESGAARQGAALLSGLVFCGGCGHAMMVGYPDTGRPYYRCRWRQKRGEPGCCGPGISAIALDALVKEQLLRALEPAALELHLKAVEDIEEQRRRLDRQWQGQLERARYEADRVERQYQAVEPENRLVARTLEQRWEEALRVVRQLEEEYNRFRQRRPVELTPQERELIEGLSQQVPALWEHASTTAAERKEIARCLIERVEARAEEKSEMVEVRIRWHGGAVSEHRVARPVASTAHMKDGEKLRERVRQLRGEGKTARQIATCLNEEGWQPPHRRGPFNYDGVRQMLARMGLTGWQKQRMSLEENEWRLADLAEKLGLAEVTLRSWLRQGWLRGRRVSGRRAWVAWADEAEVQRLQQLAQQRKQHARR